jgi:D-sedoheptulose 7-phosphate isomerase
MKAQVERIFLENARVQKEFLKEGADSITAVAEVLIRAFRNGRKVLFFGNGGSAADAQHLAAEFVNRFRFDRPALPALALTTDTSVLTSIANDAAFDTVFSRQVEALGRDADVAVGLSTSGESPNVIEGMRAARKGGLVTVAFTGAGGGHLRLEADYCLMVPSDDTPRVQEMHVLAGHAICEIVERTLAGKRRSAS